MKGILYGNFLLNKSWFIASGIVAVLGTVLCALCKILIPTTSSEFLMVLFGGVQLVTFAILTEWLGRNLEANIKCRFTDMTLAGGISKNMFVMTELVKNLLTIALGLAVCLLMQLVMNVFDNSFFTWERIKLLLLLVLFVGAFEFAMNPLIINLKSSEKAGLLFGSVVGFGIVCPLIAVSRFFEYNLLPDIYNVIISPLFTPAFVGFCAAVYVLFYFILLRRVKKGDVC